MRDGSVTDPGDALLPPLEAIEGVHATHGGRRVLSFAGCDSLGLARHPEVVGAAREALARYGVGAGASRVTTGTARPHVELEAALARFLGAEAALVLPAGWLADAAAATALAPDCDGVLIDDRAHPSLEAAARLADRPVHRFAHFDAEDADRVRAAAGLRAPLVLTDAVDLASGALAPLAALQRIAAGSGGWLLVDDAHAVGVLGERGRGALEEARVTTERVVATTVLSKALGTHGGCVSGTADLVARVRRQAPVFASATPLPPAVAAAGAAAVRLAEGGDSLRARLRERARRLRARWTLLGLAPPRDAVPWFSITGRAEGDLRALSLRLLEAGILAPHVLYAGGPPGGFVRASVCALHEPGHVDALADALARCL